jgi:hypothetical protein
MWSVITRTPTCLIAIPIFALSRALLLTVCTDIVFRPGRLIFPCIADGFDRCSSQSLFRACNPGFVVFLLLLLNFFLNVFCNSIRQDTSVWLNKHYDSTVLVTAPPSALRTAVHLATRAIMWSVLFVLPWLLFSPGKAAFFAFYPSLFYGAWYYIFSQISHINEDCFQNPVPSRDWAAHQVASSLDWGVNHPFWKVFFFFFF